MKKVSVPRERPAIPGYFRQLEERSQALGNHRRKYLHGIALHGESLIERLEATGRFDRVRLLQATTHIGAEMDAVLEAGRDDPERLAFLGCYQAAQFLLMNLRSLDFLRSGALRAQDPTGVYKEFLRRVRDDFSSLTREYLKRLLDIFLGSAPRPEFVVCVVGTRLHQDDVDMGIIDDGPGGRPLLNRAVGRMAREMVRWGSTPDFYLSEHVGDTGYSASIEEYLARLDTRILDFVSVSEILSAYPIVGSIPLFDRFRREVHSRYYYRGKRTPREHEGYLRGLLGEIEALILWPKNPDYIDPKEDLLRLASGILWAYRTIEQVAEPDAWDAFEQLGRRSRARRDLFASLEHHYTFVETFRHLYQQFVAQKERIDLTDPGEQESLQQVAIAMGYEDVGVLRAWQHLLVRYYEHTRLGRKIVEQLVPYVVQHAKDVSIFNRWLGALAGKPAEQGAMRPALDFLERARYFQGIKYWHDLLDELEDEPNGRLAALFADLSSMGDPELEKVARMYASWGHETFFTQLRLLTIFGAHARKHGAERVFRAFETGFLRSIQGMPDEIRRFSTVFMYYPGLVHRYLCMAEEGAAGVLLDRLSGEVWDSQVAAWQRRLLDFLSVIKQASRYFRRVIDRVCVEHPDCLVDFAHLDTLERVARGILADLARLPTHEEQQAALGTFYDVQLLRIGLGTLRGLSLSQIDAEFTEASDQYLRLLFDTCKAVVDRELDRRVFTHDCLALFLAGGHGRSRAHQDDYDLIVLLDSDSQEMLEYSNRILVRFNREIVKRGILPQYRFGDVFGGYVTRFSSLESYLKENAANAFIDFSQLLGARRIVGSSRFESQFRHRIIEGCIFAQEGAFYLGLAEEVRSRRRDKDRLRDAVNHDVKESEGGLRDLETAMLLLKVRYRILGPLGRTFWKELVDAAPADRALFERLRESYEFLSRLRDMYRLTVCPSNFLDAAHLERPALLLGYRPEGSLPVAERLLNDFLFHCGRSAELLYELITETEQRGSRSTGGPTDRGGAAAGQSPQAS